jgi:hypothetical protein
VVGNIGRRGSLLATGVTGLGARLVIGCSKELLHSNSILKLIWSRSTDLVPILASPKAASVVTMNRNL